MGARTIGMARMEGEGVEGRWMKNPYVFDNSYFKEVMMNKSGRYLRLESDEELARDEGLRKYAEKFAQDEEEFFRVYEGAHIKMSENG